MKLKFLGRSFLARLQGDIVRNKASYCTTSEWIEAYAQGQTFEFESQITVGPPPDLIISDKPADDAENAKRLYSWLGGLTPVSAMQLRLWAHLSHVVFPAYMHARWLPRDLNETTIRRRYFFEGTTFSSLARNGIARLWWSAHLTRDEKRKDPFELTQVLFLRQDIQVGLLEREMGKCRTARVAVLEFVRDNAWLEDEEFGARIQALVKQLNLLGGVAVLDAVPQQQIYSYLTKVANGFRNKRLRKQARSA